MIKPSVGRILWFWPEGDESGDVCAQPVAAIVTHVWSDECVNLAVFTACGEHLPCTSIALYQGSGPRPAYQFCEWMPYQRQKVAREATALELGAAVKQAGLQGD